MALIAKEKYFRSLIQYSADVITALEPDGTCRYQSPSYYQILGYEEKNTIGQRMFDLIHPDDLPEVMRQFDQVLKQPSVPVMAEYRLRKQNGDWATIGSVGNNWLAYEEVGGIVINSREITERKKAEAEIRAQSQILHGITSCMPVIVFKTEQNGRFTQITGAGLAKLGLTEKDLVGRKIPGFFQSLWSTSGKRLTKALFLLLLIPSPTNKTGITKLLFSKTGPIREGW